MSADRLAALRAGLKFCSKDHRPAIQTLIDELLAGGRASAPAVVQLGRAQTSATGATAGETAPRIANQDHHEDTEDTKAPLYRERIGALAPPLAGGGAETVKPAQIPDGQPGGEKGHGREGEEGDAPPPPSCPPCLRGEKDGRVKSGHGAERQAAREAAAAAATDKVHHEGTKGTQGSDRAALPSASAGDVNTHDDPVKSSCSPCLRGEPEAAVAARDVPVGTSWAFADHRSQAEVIAAEAAAVVTVAPRPLCQRCRQPFSRRNNRQLYCGPDCQQGRQRVFDRERAANGKIPGASAATARRAHLRDPIVPEAEAAEPPLPPRPVWRLGWDRSVMIGPARPAPVKRDADGRKLAFQDDLAALADKGSPAALLTRPALGQARASALAGAL